ncbi:non-ribosomal peptide synthetase [Psychrobacter aquimaris]|uniref:non-ribosomal peptide synthetase n=1 Tax=Psychrobacter aquimaris TaxID=292733 RepID=UPI003FD0DB86
MKKAKQSSAIEKLAIVSKHQSERSFWQRKLSINPTASCFPRVNAFTGKSCEELKFEFKPVINKRIKNLTDGIEQRILVTLLAVMSIQLSRYSGQKKVLLGVDTIGTHHECFPMVFETDLESSFKQILISVKQAYSEVLNNKSYPIELIQSDMIDLGIARDNSLFKLEVNLNTPEKKKVESIDNDSMIWGFKFIDEQLSVEIGFNCNSYSTSYVIQLVNHYQNLLEGLLNETDKSAFQYKFLSDREEYNLIENLAGRRTDYPKDKQIHYLFHKQAQLYPQRIAIIHNGREISYQELDRRSTDLALYLQEVEGIKKGDRVALFLEKSLESIVSILAILKCGAIYAPLDTNTPPKRLKSIIKILSPELIITNSLFMIEVSNINMSLFIYDKQMNFVPPAESEILFNQNDENLAYIMFTSGTTGEPKGVKITHQGVIRLIKDTNYIDFESGSRVLLASSLAFDASTFELWGMLLNGGTVCLEPKETLLDYRLLHESLLNHKITHMFFTTAWFHQLVDYDPDIFSGLKYLLMGGDVLSPRHVNTVRKQYPDLTMIHVYGPTENTTFSTYYEIKSLSLDAIPLGRPVANSTVYIFDSNNNMLPTGVWGEIVVGGDGVACGYWQNEEETTKQFILKKFNNKLPQCLYRTGDVGRILPNGIIEFAGRVDNQVKIRGFRVELREVENVITNISGVSDAKVIVKSNNDDKYLIAYVVHKNVMKEEIRNILATSLPDYMVPRYIEFLNEFPLTVNGKIDVSSLPAPELSQSKEGLSQPSTDSEIYVAKVWSRLLDVDQNSIGLESDFFEIGGHSLTATLFISQVHKELGVVITLNEVFQFSDLKTIASIVSEAKINIS